MMHIIECHNAKPLWQACAAFTTRVLGHAPPTNVTLAVIFGVWSSGKLGPEDARALLRHAYGQYYHDFSNVDLKKRKFQWQSTYYYALLSYRDAVTRYATQLNRLHTLRRLTSRKKQAKEEAYTKYGTLIAISTATYRLNDAFTTAIEDAKQAARDAKLADRAATNNSHQAFVNAAT